MLLILHSLKEVDMGNILRAAADESGDYEARAAAMMSKKQQKSSDDREATFNAGKVEAEAKNAEKKSENAEQEARRAEQAAKAIGREGGRTKDAEIEFLRRLATKGRKETEKPETNPESGFFYSIKDPGFILFIFGLATFLLSGYFDAFTIFFATFFMIYSAMFVFRGRGLVLVMIFWVWYVFYGGVSDPKQLIYVAPAALFVAIVARGFYAKLSKNEPVVSGAAGELVGLVPIGLFFLNIGLVEFLQMQYHYQLSTMTINLLKFCPWWAMLGIFTTKKENGLITTSKILTIVYLFFLITAGVETNISPDNFLPNAGDLQNAQKQMSELNTGESPVVSLLACIMEFDPTNLDACQKARQERAKYEGLCKEARDLEKCIAEQQAIEHRAIMVTGVVDPTITQPMTAKFEIGQYFPKTFTRSLNGPERLAAFPMTLKIENPRMQAFTVELSCKFRQGVRNETPGQIVGQNTFEVKEKNPTLSTVCQAPAILNGTYTLVYEAKFPHLITASRLKRVFMAKRDYNEGPLSEKEDAALTELENKLRRDFSGGNGLPQAAPDFARLYFSFGNPIEDPIIKDNQNLILSSTVENTGQGDITAILKYNLLLDGFTVDDSTNLCKEGRNPPLARAVFRQTVIPLATCIITGIPADLQNPRDYERREYVGVLEYSYKVWQDISGIQITFLEEQLAQQGGQ